MSDHRDNLDPFGDYGDAVLIATLERVHLTTSTESVRTSRASSIHTGEGSDARPGTPSSGSGTTFYGDERKNLITLESKVSPGGSNFSQGQRQLIAMARALLR